MPDGWWRVTARVKQGVVTECRGQGPHRVGVMESLSEKITFKLRSGRHKAANQEPKPEIGRDFSASKTQKCSCQVPG